MPGAIALTLPCAAVCQVMEANPGSSFGELALMYNAPRAATVVSAAPDLMYANSRLIGRTVERLTL